MGWKSTKEITRENLEEKILYELTYNIESLSDETLTQILEILGEDENSSVDDGYNYWIIE